MLDNFYGFECAETNHGVQNLSLDEVSYLVFKSIICTSSIIQPKPKLNVVPMPYHLCYVLLT